MHCGSFVRIPVKAFVRFLASIGRGYFIPLYLFLSYSLLHEKGSLIFGLPFS